MTRVSVVMALYNGEKYLDKQLGSMVTQLTDQDELIIADDGSTDESLTIVARYQAVFPQIRVIGGDHVGVVANFKRGILEAKGKFIFLADQDDIWLSGKVSGTLEHLERMRRPALVMHDAAFIDAEGRRLNQTLFRWRPPSKGFWKNVWKNCYTGCCMAFSCELVPYIRKMPVHIPMHDEWIGLLGEQYGFVDFLNVVMIEYRRHAENTTSGHHRSIARMAGNRVWVVLLFFIQLMRGKGFSTGRHSENPAEKR